jgi:hypothetical protein
MPPRKASKIKTTVVDAAKVASRRMKKGTGGKRPALSPQRAARVMAGIRWLYERPPYNKNATPLARKLGLSQPGLSALLLDKNGPSLDTAEAVAQQFGVDLMVLLDSAWSPGDPPPEHIVLLIAHDPRHPNRALALALADKAGFDREVLDRVRAYDVAEGQPDPSVQQWLRLVLHEQQKRDDLAAFRNPTELERARVARELASSLTQARAALPKPASAPDARKKPQG